MDLQTFKVRNTDFSFTIVTNNVAQGTALYVRLNKNNVSQLLTSDAARTLFDAYSDLEDLFSRLCYTHIVSYLAIRDDETPVSIVITKNYDGNGTVSCVKWKLCIRHEPTDTYTDFSIDRKSLWRINLYDKVLSNALFYWWWKVNEAELRLNSPLLRCLYSLKDICKHTLLKTALKGEFISQEILSLYPSTIQTYLRTWPGKYEILYGHDLARREPHDSGHDSDFM